MYLKLENDWVTSKTQFHPRTLKAIPFFVLFSECALEDETYEDGAETQVECNRCVCACGNWVCTAMTCEGMYNQKISDYLRGNGFP